MKVNELGEFGLIDMIAQVLEESGVGSGTRPEVIIGIGDDAAAVGARGHVPLRCNTLVTSDILVQDVHFTLATTTWRDLGWKALAVNISDIAAMGGTPSYAVISLGVPPETESDSIGELYRGMAEIAREFGMAITGGDVTESPLLIISPSIIGEVEEERMLIRSGAKPGDRIAVTGYLGASAAGLRMLQENLKFDTETESALRTAHVHPWPRVVEGQTLARYGVKAAIDVSDGLIADLGHICEASGVEARVNLPDVPVHPAVREGFGEEGFGLAVGGGEDYELLFTAPEEVVKDVRQALSTPVAVVGEVGEGEKGKVRVFDGRGKEVDWQDGGWEHFGKRLK
ncbi:MAG: thiamine-phosphate kinase [Chloroflexota bacterium]